MKDPAMDGAMNHSETPLGHHFFNIPITERIGQIPVNTLEDHVVLKMSGLEGDGCHVSLPYMAACYHIPIFATEPPIVQLFR